VVICASFFGVPQRRWRIFIVGARLGCPLPLPPQPTHYPTTKGPLRTPSLPGDWNKLKVFPPKNIQIYQDTFDDEDAISFTDDEDEHHHVHDPDNLKPEVNVFQAIGDLSFYENDDAYIKDKIYSSPPFTEYQKMVRKDEEFCSQHWGKQLGTKGMEKVTLKIPEHKTRVRWDKPFSTICCSFNGKTSFLHPKATRYLSLRECARAQSFPDDVWFFGTMTDKYTQIGNAVPPLLGKALGLVFVNLDKNISKDDAATTEESIVLEMSDTEDKSI